VPSWLPKMGTASLCHTGSGGESAIGAAGESREAAKTMLPLRDESGTPGHGGQNTRQGGFKLLPDPRARKDGSR
jgi:hypothetical protein